MTADVSSLDPPFPRIRLAKRPPISIREALDPSPKRLGATIGSWPGAALLESGPGFGDSGRWSILSAHPRLVFEAFGSRWTIRQPSGLIEASGNGDPLTALGIWINDLGLARRESSVDPDHCPFQFGLIGAFGYDIAPLLEHLPRKAVLDTAFPDIRFGLYDTAVTIDHRTGATYLQAGELLGEGKRAVEERLRDWRSELEGTTSPAMARSSIDAFRGNFTKQGYLASVRRALDYIEAGDIFQVNLSQRFEATGQLDPLNLYLRLKESSPAPFSAFLRSGDQAIISASPEWFYTTMGDRVITRPIKGTRPRGTTVEQDSTLKAELLASPKDRAELTMVVDLERNDLGRVCQYGSVRVRDPMTIESFAQVHHLVATVEGVLRPKATPIDVVRAMFPGGSITGAPKIRAMEIIDELEPTRRGLYTGALGYFSHGGSSAFNILIRTMLVEGNRVRYQVGGGIVADSDPLAEYEETLHKGRGIREVLENEGINGSR